MQKKYADYDAIVSTLFDVVKLGIRIDQIGLCGVDYLSANTEEKPAQKGLAKEAVDQLKCYFKDPVFQFSLPLSIEGSHFQKSVWSALYDIKLGAVCSYGALAKNLSTSPRAVGGACRTNPIPIIVPCHRVVAAAGIGGYSGQVKNKMIKIKHWLLEHEKGRNSL